MKARNAITIKQNVSDHSRIGPNKRNKNAVAAVEIEKVILDNALLPTTYDVSSIQPNYFSEFTYFDCLNGVLLATMSAEVTAIAMEEAVNQCTKVDYGLVDKLLNSINDKYQLGSPTLSHLPEDVIFMAGGNLFKAMNKEIIDREMLYNPNCVIKAHPVTNDDALRALGVRYGYHRIIDPKESGMEYLKAAKNVFTASNSELGLVAAALEKNIINITAVKHEPILTYSSIYRLFTNDKEHNYEVLAKVLSSPISGLIMPFHEDKEQRVKDYCEFTLELREYFRPRYPANIYKSEI